MSPHLQQMISLPKIFSTPSKLSLHFSVHTGSVSLLNSFHSRMFLQCSRSSSSNSLHVAFKLHLFTTVMQLGHKPEVDMGVGMMIGMGVGLGVEIEVGMVGMSLELGIDVIPTVLVGQKHVSLSDTSSSLGLRTLIMSLSEIASLPQAKKMDWQCSSIS